MMMTAIGMMVIMVDDGDGDQKQDQPGKLLGQGWGGEGAPSLLTSDYDSYFDFKRISLLFTLYFIALDFPYLLKHISQIDTYLIMDISEGVFSKSHMYVRPYV